MERMTPQYAMGGLTYFCCCFTVSTSSSFNIDRESLSDTVLSSGNKEKGRERERERRGGSSDEVNQCSSALVGVALKFKIENN